MKFPLFQDRELGLTLELLEEEHPTVVPAVSSASSTNEEEIDESVDTLVSVRDRSDLFSLQVSRFSGRLTVRRSYQLRVVEVTSSSDEEGSNDSDFEFEYEFHPDEGGHQEENQRLKMIDGDDNDDDDDDVTESKKSKRGSSRNRPPRHRKKTTRLKRSMQSLDEPEDVLVMSSSRSFGDSTLETADTFDALEPLQTKPGRSFRQIFDQLQAEKEQLKNSIDTALSSTPRRQNKQRSPQLESPEKPVDSPVSTTPQQLQEQKPRNEYESTPQLSSPTNAPNIVVDTPIRPVATAAPLTMISKHSYDEEEKKDSTFKERKAGVGEPSFSSSFEPVQQRKKDTPVEKKEYNLIDGSEDYFMSKFIEIFEDEVAKEEGDDQAAEKYVSSLLEPSLVPGRSISHDDSSGEIQHNHEIEFFEDECVNDQLLSRGFENTLLKDVQSAVDEMPVIKEDLSMELNTIPSLQEVPSIARHSFSSPISTLPALMDEAIGRGDADIFRTVSPPSTPEEPSHLEFMPIFATSSGISSDPTVATTNAIAATSTAQQKRQQLFQEQQKRQTSPTQQNQKSITFKEDAEWIPSIIVGAPPLECSENGEETSAHETETDSDAPKNEPRKNGVGKKKRRKSLRSQLESLGSSIGLLSSTKSATTSTQKNTSGASVGSGSDTASQKKSSLMRKLGGTIKTKDDDSVKSGQSFRSGQSAKSGQSTNSVLSNSLGPKKANRRWSMLSKAVEEKKIVKNDGCRTTILCQKEKRKVAYPTFLHDLCDRSDVSIRELEKELEVHPESARQKDSLGRLPLHILSDNDDLVATPIGKTVATNFCRQLMQIYPDGITMTDGDGHMPFVKLIIEWHNYTYEKHAKKSATKSNTTTNKMVVNIVGALESIRGPDESIVKKSDDSNPDNTTNYSGRDGDFDDFFTAGSPTRDFVTYSSRSFPRVELWDEVKWCFEMLTIAMDDLGGKTEDVANKLRRTRGGNDGARTALATHATMMIPTLLKTLLLNDENGGATRKKIFKSSFVRRLFLCPESVGPWITSMLRKTGTPSSRAIDYLVEVSNITPKDYVGEYRSVNDSDINHFLEHRDRIFAEIDALEGTVASLVVLSKKEVERAAATTVVWKIMNKSLSRPFVVALLMVDFVLHMTLLFAFRNAVSVIIDVNSSLGSVPDTVVFLICVHYLIRKGCEAFSLVNLSLTVFRSYFANVWTVFELVSIVLTIFAIVWRQADPDVYRQGLNSFVLGLLWLKVLSFLKVVNKQMSTFILALIQILQDLRYFAVVFIVFIFMFADMLRIAISNKRNGKFCNILHALGELDGPVKDFCSENPLDSVTRVYSVVIGDFELSDYQLSEGMTILFVMLTLVGVIIMLNVLIAVISDSYEKAKIQSGVIFGRARVGFVAQFEALESFLLPNSNSNLNLIVDKATPKAYLKIFGRIVRWCILISLIVTAMFALIYLCGRAIVGIRDGMPLFRLCLVIIFIIILVPAMWVLILAVFGGVYEFFPRRIRGCFRAIDRVTDYVVRVLASRLLGLKDTRGDSWNPEESSYVDEEWKGRLYHIEKSFEKKVDQETQDLKSEMQDLEKRIYGRIEEFLKNKSKDDNSSSNEAPKSSNRQLGHES